MRCFFIIAYKKKKSNEIIDKREKKKVEILEKQEKCNRNR